MFGLSDIPFLGKVVDKISQVTVAAMFRGLRYTFRYKALVNDLESKIDILNVGEKERISVKVNEEKANGKIIYNEVLNWQRVVDEIQTSAKEISPSWNCIQCLPIPNPVARFQIGKEAALKVKTVTGLAHKGREFLATEIAYLPAVENVAIAGSAFRNFHSRNYAYEKIRQDIVNQDGPMIVGIYGLAGVGKTRMMQQIWKEATEKGIFNKVTLAVVGGEDQLDVINLQEQIASHLGCNLVSASSTRHRANQLKNSLMNGGKILIILDDVWTDIPLEDIIGTCLSDDNMWMGYKILLTSRERSVCLNNNCQHPVEIQALTVPEAWDMFKNTVGTGEIESLNDEPLAKEVCHKCDGLPLVIQAVAKALKSNTHNLWMDTLRRLGNCNTERVPGISRQVYTCLKLSLDKLEEDAKQCLLLCSLFPKDADISMRRLIQFATGSQLVGGGRIRILAMVDILKSSLLLVQGKDDEHFKLQGLIRDVATSVAVQDYAFLRTRCGSQLPEYSTRKILHLDWERNDIRLPDDLGCPDLHTLSLQGQNEIYIPTLSRGMFVNLKFVVLTGFISRRVSLQSLDKLETLFLDDCDIRNTNVSLFPKNLKTLCIWDCILPACLKLPNLNDLEKLEIGGRHKLQVGANAISRLRGLKELYLEYPSENWDVIRGSFMPKFKDISRLTCLTSLKIFWDNFEASQDTSIFSSLNEFHIRVGGRGKNKKREASKVSLKKLIELSYGNHFEGFHGLIGKAEQVILLDTNVDVSEIWNSNREAFQDLRNLYIEKCNSMEHLARISHYEIQFSLRQQKSFSRLTNLKITNCSGMRYLVSKSVAKCLVQLQYLSIFGCDLMEVIVMNEGLNDGGEIISFSNLISLKLSDMQRLTTFYGTNRDDHSSLISDMDKSVIRSSQSLPLFDAMVAFPCLVKLELGGLKETSDIWGETDNESSFCKLKSLVVSSCDKLEIVIPLFMLDRLRNLEFLKVNGCNSLHDVFRPLVARGLVHLKELEVMYCEKMTEIIGAGQQKQEFTDCIITFLELTSLKLKFLPNLSLFWLYQAREAQIYQVQFPNLVDLTLHDVKFNLEVIELGGELGRYDSTCLVKNLDIRCDKMIQLPCTWQLHLDNLESLVLGHCWSDELKSLSFQKVKVLKVLNLRCSTLFTLSVIENLQQLHELEISNCGLLEEIVEDVRGDATTYGMNKKPITLFKLRSIFLKDLPNLKRFFTSASYDLYMPALENVKVDNCGLLTSLFTCSVLKNLQQLQFLHVYNCRLLEGIVDNARGIESFDNIIKLSALSKIFLKDLPYLKSFGLTVNYAFSMPKLLNFSLVRCPCVENFTALKTKTGRVTVDSEWHQQEKVTDLNKFAKQYRRRCDSAKDQPLQVTFLSFPWSCPWAC